MKIDTINFWCANDLDKPIDSMLFDKGTQFAEGTFMVDDEHKVWISLEISGEVSVDYKGVRYNAPSEFPDELKDLIRNHPEDYYMYASSGEGNDEEEGDISIRLNNWFEYIYTIDDKWSDGVLEESDLTKLSPEDIKETMLDIIRDKFS